MNAQIDVIGNGLVGPLAAGVLARRGYRVTAWDRRPDPRHTSLDAGRSINLALSTRGLAALKLLELDQTALDMSLPMRGRFLHAVDGRTQFIPYGSRASDVIHSISRGGLNQLLLSAAEKQGQLNLQFNQQLKSFNPANGELRFVSADTGAEANQQSSHVIGADGSTSEVRNGLATGNTHFQADMDWLAHGYKELAMPPTAAGEFQLRSDCLHIWPRGDHMLIALPNLDRSFTCTLFLAHQGENSFDSLTTVERIRDLFQSEFPDAWTLIPDLVEQFMNHPTGKLGTMRCSPWHNGDRVLLLGDAAHAVVPFFGQGMNCAFEDVSALQKNLDACPNDLETVFRQTHVQRKKNADAIATMAVENYQEMRQTVADPLFQLMKKVEHYLERELPEHFMSRYSMVSFSRIPYRIALSRGRLQEQVIRKYCQGKNKLEELDSAALIEEFRRNQCPLDQIEDD